MKFNIYGRFQVEVRRENGTWLDDVFHEYAGIGQTVEPLPD
jgi:hypothetical protein